MKRVLSILFTTLCTVPAWAADGEYAADKIAATLLKNAHAVVRKHDVSVEMRSLDKMVIRDKLVLTVLDEKGSDFAYMMESYDKFNSIESMDGTLYDATGKKMKSVRKSEIKDMSTNSGESLATDGRVKYFSFYCKTFPYTVEFETEVVKQETMFYPTWNPVLGEHVAVEQSALVVTVPKDYTLRYKAYNAAEPATAVKDKKEYRWQVSGFAAVEREYASPSWKKLVPYILMAPSEFQIEDYKGNMTDWTEYGKFLLALNKGLDVLPPAIQQKVHQLTDGLSSREEKVQALYTFLQNNTHYISIQLGIGGWRPFDANYVSSKAYGDCKALSNYMVSLLKEAGIPAYYTLVSAGDYKEDIITEFASSQFNHVITCVPNGKDTIWLECTSQTVPAGYMGEFTGNRHALLITENGGKLVATPRYSFSDNVKQRSVSAIINEEGKLTAHLTTRYKAMAGDELYGVVHGYTNEKIREYLKERIDLPSFDIKNFSFNEVRTAMPSIDENIDVVADNYASVSGRRLFISPNIFSKTTRRLDASEQRKFDIELSTESTSIDSVNITIPSGYKLEALAQDNKLDSKWGKYNTSIKVDNDKVLYIRRFEQYSGHYPASDYADLSRFYDQVYKADRTKIVLVKNEQ